MKRKFLPLALMLGLSTMVHAMSFDQLYDTLKQEPKAEKLHLGRGVMFFMNMLSDSDTRMERLCSVTIENCTAELVNMAKQCFAAADPQTYEPLVAKNDKDEIIRILVKASDAYFEEVVILLWEDDELNFIRMWGKIAPKEITMESAKKNAKS